jgi:hypothetical protein
MKATGFRYLPCPRVSEVSMDIIAATMGLTTCMSQRDTDEHGKMRLVFRPRTHKRIDEHEDECGNWPATPARLRDLQHVVVARSTWARCPNTVAAESALCGAG